jgi:pimeloyl-ACP methyl ester carboxylesterase
VSPQALPPLQSTALAHGVMTWREAGPKVGHEAGHGAPLLLLHGIGSGSGSWGGQFEALAATHRVIAWDAPGYGRSDPLPNPKPLAIDYARVLDGLLEALEVDEAIVLGHSLGAIVAAAWCATTQRRVRGLLLASPARGYATASDEVRESKYRERIELVDRLGVEGLAAQRSAALCAPHASAQTVAAVRENMALITPGGYGQAAWMLAHDDLLSHLRHAPKPLAVLCGELDRTTPPQACERIALECGAPFVPLHSVAHACYVEDPAQFNTAMQGALLSEVPHG